MTTLTVGTANFFVGNTQVAKDAKFLASLGIDIAGIQEGHSGNAQGIRDALNKDFNTIITGNTLEAQDVPVVVARKIKVTNSWGRQISKRSQKENIGMPRSTTVVRFELNGEKYRLFNTHTNAAVQNRETGQPLSRKIKRVSEFIAGMIILEAMIRAGQKAGDHILVTGDLNYREVKKGVWKFSPQALFQRTKLDYVNQGLDYIAASKDLSLGRPQVIDAKKTGSDHPWLIVKVTKKRS